MQNIEEIAFLVRKSNREVESIKRQLSARLESLSVSLIRESDRIKKDETYRPNSLGVIQWSGLTIDLLCANLYAEMQHLKELKRLLNTFSNQESNEAP